MAIGASVQIFLPSGSTDGIWVIQKSNWTGIGLVIPRSHFSEGRQREELAGTGVYVLVGPAGSEAFDQQVYVGESDNLKQRLDNHMKALDFWNRAIVFSAKDGNLNKAHALQLEYRLIGLAKESGRAEVANSTKGTASALAEAETALVEGFLAEMLTLYPVLGLSAFETSKSASQVARVRLFCSGPDAQAEGFETADGFVVLGGALIRRRQAASTYPAVTKRLDAMAAEGLLESVDEKSWRLTADHVFTSPSLAADVVLGRSANGRTEWRNAEGTTLKELQEAGLDE